MQSILYLLERPNQYPVFIKEIIRYLGNSCVEPIGFRKILVDNHISLSESYDIIDVSIKSMLADIVLDYADICVEDNYIEESEAQMVRRLMLLFRIEVEDFRTFNKMDRVHTIILKQFERMYADNTIDEKEILEKGSLQGLFGLGYSEFDELAQIGAKEAIARGADPKKLDTFVLGDKYN